MIVAGVCVFLVEIFEWFSGDDDVWDASILKQIDLLKSDLQLNTYDHMSHSQGIFKRKIGMFGNVKFHSLVKTFSDSRFHHISY